MSFDYLTPAEWFSDGSCEDCIGGRICGDCGGHFCCEPCDCGRSHNCPCECRSYDRRLTYAD